MCPSEKTLTAPHLVDDDIDACTTGTGTGVRLFNDDACTMEEARNLNFCTSDGGGASEHQRKVV